MSSVVYHLYIKGFKKRFELERKNMNISSSNEERDITGARTGSAVTNGVETFPWLNEIYTGIRDYYSILGTNERALYPKISRYGFICRIS